MARGRSKEDSVYDFFYVDSRRIGVLLSQFGQDGILTELTRATEASDEGGGGINIQIAKIEGKEGSKTSLGKRFDPQWLMPLLFLDAAQDRIKRDLKKAGIGQLVLITGGMSIIYTRLAESIWGLSSAKRSALQSIDLTLAKHEPNITSEEKEKRRLATETNMETISILPHSTQAIISSAGESIWSTLIDEYVIGGVDDMMLKHGSEVSGEWSVVGILDALPDKIKIDSFPPLADVLNSNDPKYFRQMLSSLTLTARHMLGRPYEMSGVTPLLIFRNIAR